MAEAEIGPNLASILNRILILNHDELKEKLEAIMANQADFDAQITRANAALENVTSEIAAQRQEIQDFIAANPGVDTSALEAVVTSMESLGSDVDAIFEAPAAEEPAPPNPEESPEPEA